MAVIHEYENWLDEVERKITISDGIIRASLKKQYLIPLEACSTPKKALCQACAFSANLLSNEEDLPWDTLALHMLRLAGSANQLSINAENLYRGNQIRVSGDFKGSVTSNTGDDSTEMEFKGTPPNYLRLSLSPAINGMGNTLKLHKLHAFTSSMHEFVEVTSLGVVPTTRHIILCLPDGIKWSLYDGAALQQSGWYGQDATRLALGFTDTETLRSSHSRLCKFLGNGILMAPSWAVSLERQTLQTRGNA